MDNISGTFQIDLDGKRKTLKATIGLTERLEKEIFKRPLITALKEALAGNPFVMDVYHLIHEAMRENGDTRTTLYQVGEAILRGGGTAAFLQIHIDVLTYLLSGGVPPESQNSDDKKK